MENELKNKLTREEQFFIRVLRDYLHEEPTETDPSLNWKLIKEYADRHQLSAIFYKQTKNEIFRKSYAFQLYHYQNLNQILVSLKELLKDCEYIMVKGMDLAELYPTPALRSMGDIDILIHEKDREKIHGLLLDGGFCFKGEYIASELKYEKNGYALEVHDSLVHRSPGKEKRVTYFQQAWAYAKNGKLDWSFHLLYLIEHLRQHFVGKGVGFRQFLDIAFVCEKGNIDWSFLSEELKKLELYEFATSVFAFLESWLKIRVPFEKRRLSEAFYCRASRKIFADGVFGFDNEENQGVSVAVRMCNQGIGARRAKLEYLFNRALPPMRHMLRLPYCAYLHKYKFLLPFAWIHRFFYRIRDKKVRGMVKAPLADAKIKERLEFLKEWGLAAEKKTRKVLTTNESKYKLTVNKKNKP